MSAPTTDKKPPQRRRKRGGRGRVRLFGCLGILLTLTIGAASIWILVLDREITRTFKGRLWAIPSRVYSAPLTLREGDPMSIARIQARLDRAGWRPRPIGQVVPEAADW